MDEENDNIGILFIILIGFSFIVIAFIYDYYNLKRFKKCYDNDFKYSYCTKYRNY